MNNYKYLGSIHIHTKYSDGTGDISEITKAAKKAGLSWILITDHNNIDVEEGIINGIYVIKGEEISKTSSNHYIAVGLKKTVQSDIPEEFIKEIIDNSGFGFVAHPHESLNRKNKSKPIRWESDTEDIQGVEIWNWFSQWADNYNDKNIFTMAYSYFFRHNLITKPYSETLKLWDELNNADENIIPAICGVDVHALIVKKFFIPFKIFPYECLFKTLSNEIFLKEPLSDNYIKAKEQILNTLRNGKNIIVNRYINNHVPIIMIENREEAVSSGESIYLDDKTYLITDLPKQCQIKIIKDGKLYQQFNKKNLKFQITEPGKYRVEIEINGKGYSYSNPMRVNQR